MNASIHRKQFCMALNSYKIDIKQERMMWRIKQIFDGEYGLSLIHI